MILDKRTAPPSGGAVLLCIIHGPTKIPHWANGCFPRRSRPPSGRPGVCAGIPGIWGSGRRRSARPSLGSSSRGQIRRWSAPNRQRSAPGPGAGIFPFWGSDPWSEFADRRAGSSISGPCPPGSSPGAGRSAPGTRAAGSPGRGRSGPRPGHRRGGRGAFWCGCRNRRQSHTGDRPPGCSPPRSA